MNLIIYGDSNYAELIKYYFESDSNYKVVGFCVDKAYKNRDELCNLPVVAFEDIENHFPVETHHIFAAIGYKSMRTRQILFEKMRTKKYTIASYISSKAIVDDSNEIGENCTILPGAILEPFVKIHSNCFINTGVVICHHSKIEAHCFLAAGSLIGGYAVIEECSFVGFRATVIQQLKLATETLVAANSTLLKNTEESTMYAGSPAKAIRTHLERGIEII